VVAADLVECATESARVAAELQRFGKSATDGTRYVSFGDEPVECGTGRRRRGAKLGDRPVAVGHDKSLPVLDSTEVLAEVLTQLGYPYCGTGIRHVHEGSTCCMRIVEAERDIDSEAGACRRRRKRFPRVRNSQLFG
jgi:hypothetical protein